jgi:hypothetical protein
MFALFAEDFDSWSKMQYLLPGWQLFGMKFVTLRLQKILFFEFKSRMYQFLLKSKSQ